MTETPDTECKHENIEFEEGNFVPPYGWETSPGYYCHDCGEMMPDDYAEAQNEPDPDFEIKYRKEND